MRRFSPEIPGRLLPEPEDQTPEELGVGGGDLRVPGGACLSIRVWCGGGGVESQTEERECSVLTEPCCLPGSEVALHPEGDSLEAACGLGFSS